MNYLFGAYAIFVLVYLVYSAAGIYHLWRFGYSGDFSKLIIVVYSALSIGVIASSIAYLTIYLLEA